MNKLLAIVACLLVLVLPATASAVAVSQTFVAEITGVSVGGNVDLAVGNLVTITYGYDTSAFTEVVAGLYEAAASSVTLDFSANAGGEVFSAKSFGSDDIQLVTNLAQDTVTISNTNANASWVIVMQDPDGSALTSNDLPTSLAGFNVVGTTFDFGGDGPGGTVEFAAGGADFKAFTATIPEPSAFLFGSVVFGLVGFAKVRRARKA